MDDLEDLLGDNSDNKPKKKQQSFLTKYRGNSSGLEYNSKPSNLFQTFTTNQNTENEKIEEKNSNENVNTDKEKEIRHKGSDYLKTNEFNDPKEMASPANKFEGIGSRRGRVCLIIA